MQAFRTESSYPVISEEAAWEILAGRVRPLDPRQIALGELLGLVLAEEVRAAEDLPPFAASTMDGYAVIAADESARRAVLGEQDAGMVTEQVVRLGTAMRIMTGAPLPPGADAVIQVEDTSEKDGVASLQRRIKPGQNVRPMGSDVAAGVAVLGPGTRIGPAEIGLLATVGRSQALAHPRPVVVVAATGDELVQPGEPLGPGQIRDSNSHALAAAIEAAGAVAMRTQRIADSYEALRAALLSAAQTADMVLTSGGVSMGTHDLVKPVLEELGQVHFGRVAIKPGKPLTYATLERNNGGTCHFFGLPGNPVSSLVTFEMAVRPVLRLLMGFSALWHPEAEARLEHKLRHDADRTEYQRAIVTRRDGTLWASTTGSQASSRILSLVGANALLRIPTGVGDLEAGETVQAVLIDLPETEAAS